MTPPRVAEAVLRWLLAPRDRNTIPADLAEAYMERVTSRGRGAATRWYVRQMFSIAWHVAPRSPKHSSASLGIVLGLVMAVGVVVTNVLLPLAHLDIMENDFTERLPWLAVFGCVLLAGWLAHRRAGLAASVRAGGIVAFLAFAIVILTFLLVDNVFLDLVSQQPDKQRFLRESGYQSMRLAITIAQLRALITVLPVLSLVGALVGGVGGILAKLRAR